MTITSLDRLYQPAPLEDAVGPEAARLIRTRGTTRFAVCPACDGYLWVVDLDGRNLRPCPECLSDEARAELEKPTPPSPPSPAG